MFELNENGYGNVWPRGSYNNPLDLGESVPGGFEDRHIYMRGQDGEITKTINPSF